MKVFNQSIGQRRALLQTKSILLCNNEFSFNQSYVVLAVVMDDLVRALKRILAPKCHFVVGEVFWWWLQVVSDGQTSERPCHRRDSALARASIRSSALTISPSPTPTGSLDPCSATTHWHSAAQTRCPEAGLLPGR